MLNRSQFFSLPSFRAITENKMANSTNGKAYLDGIKVFYKICNVFDGYHEIKGYALLHQRVPLPSLLLFRYDPINDIVLIVYELDESVSANKGLLVDAFADKNAWQIINDKVLVHLQRLFQQSFRATPEDPLFSNRLDRLFTWYVKDNTAKFHIDYNGMMHSWQEIVDNTYAEISRFYSVSNRVTRCTISHGDLSELNISLHPYFFDFAFSGINSIYSEFAICFSSIAFENYFDMIYHHSSYKNHYQSISRSFTHIEVDYQRMNTTFSIKDFTVKLCENRKNLLDQICVCCAGCFDDYPILRAMMIFRLISVRDIRLYREEDFVRAVCICIAISKTRNLNELQNIICGLV